MKSHVQIIAVEVNNTEVSIGLKQTFAALGIIGVIVLSATFFAYRGNDVGELPTLLTRFLTELTSAKILTLGGLLKALERTMVAALIVFAWFGLGASVFRLLKVEITESPLPLTLALYCASGASLWSLLWFGLGIAQLFRASCALLLLLIGLLLAGYEGLKIYKIKRDSEENSFAWFAKTTIIFILFPVLLAFISALAPTLGKDAMVYRLAVPKAWLVAGGMVDVSTNIFSHLSFGAEMNGVWAMLLANFINPEIAETAFGLVALASFPLLLLAVYGLAREWWLPRDWALLAVLIVAAIPTMYQVAASGYVDHTLAWYVTLAIYAAGKWWQSQSRSSAIILALSLGAAFAVKLIALFAFVPLFIIILFKVRALQNEGATTGNTVLMKGLAILAAAGVLASPWYMRVWLKTGSPMFPFYAHLWKGSAPGWDAERSALSGQLMRNYGGANKGIVDYLLTPLHLSLQAQPEIPAYFDGVLGISLLLGLPLLAWGLWRMAIRSEIKIAVSMAGGWYLCWLFTSQQLRFLLPILPALALTIIFVIAQVDSSRKGKNNIFKAVIFASAWPGLLVILSWFLAVNPVRAALGGEPRDSYLEQRLDYYSYYKIINRDLPKEARVWLINLRNDTVHLERQYLADFVFEDYTLTKFVQESASLSELRGKIKQLGVTHILIRTDVLLDYARSPIVDEKKSTAQNEEKLNLLKSLLSEEVKVLQSDTKFMLVELPLTPSARTWF